jgi:hypothetical protein
VRFVLAAFVFVLTLCANTSDAAQSYQIASGATVSISEHGACRKVTNGYSAQPLFVPTNTPAEWSSFIAGAPSGIGLAACDSVTVFLIAGSSWSVPADWNSSINTVHVIGGGAGGRSSIANNTGGGGGGGGAYSAASNLTLTPGASVDYAVGAGGNAGSTAQAGGATWFNGTGLGLASVSAAGGGAPSLATMSVVRAWRCRWSQRKWRERRSRRSCAGWNRWRRCERRNRGWHPHEHRQRRRQQPAR